MFKDIDKEVYSMLSELGYPVDLEMNTDSKTTLPCITYLQLNESTNAWGDTLAYNNVAYQVKIWSRNMSDIATIKYDLMKKIKVSGWALAGANQTSHEGVICHTMTIEAITYLKEEK